jgi:hypothetical protein
MSKMSSFGQKFKRKLKNILLGMSDVSAKCSRENRKTYLK